MTDSNSRHYWQLLQALEALHAAGVQQLPHQSAARVSSREVSLVATVPSHGSPATERTPETLAPSEPTAPQSATQGSAVAFGQRETASEGVSPDEQLQILCKEVANCVQCQELATTRTQTVFGVGNPRARLCLMGEAPGADEDRQGEPFVGRAGQLLNKILEACKLRREDVYILNVLKCRPPNNRNPTAEESQNCRGFLNRQLELISPEFICCLGAVAAQNLLDTTEAIGRLRGKLHDYRGIKVICTYHPAYLLRTPAAKRHTWDDMKLLMRLMGTPVD